MSNFFDILTQPDNLPVAAMAVALIFLLWVWLKQALEHDRLRDEGRPEEIVKRMRR